MSFFRRNTHRCGATIDRGQKMQDCVPPNSLEMCVTELLRGAV
jgi:hypothetical protein